MNSPYLAISIFIVIAVLIAIVPMVLAKLLSRSKPNKVKVEAYECGNEPSGDVRRPFHIKFIVFALMFLLFDIETVLFFPWVVSLRHIGWFGFGSMLIFVLILAVGFIYEWQQGAFKWQ